MRLFACITAMSLLGPPFEAPEPGPSTEPIDPAALSTSPGAATGVPEIESTPAPEPAPSDPAPGSDETEPSAPPPIDSMFADDTPSSDPSPATELEATAAGLAGAGECHEAIALYREAYALAPGEHRIAYAIASCALEIGDCETMRVHLAHFIRYADPVLFPNKLAKARRTLAADSCQLPIGSGDPEVLEARKAGGPRGGLVRGATNNGSGLVGGGVVMVGVGILAFVAGVALVGVGLHRSSDAAASLDVEAITRNRNLMIAGGVAGPAGVVLVVGGSVMVARGNSPAYVQLGPAGATVRF